MTKNQKADDAEVAAIEAALLATLAAGNFNNPRAVIAAFCKIICRMAAQQQEEKKDGRGETEAGSSSQR